MIARGDQPVATLTPVRAKGARKSREPGQFKGQFTLTNAFFEPLPDEELRAWEGED